MRKLRLINPIADRTAGLSGNLRSRHPPLSLASLAALTPEGWSVEIIDENTTRHEFEDCDLAAFTSFTSTAPRAYELAAEYRAAGIPTVGGGVHVWAREREALQHFDAIVVQEAESVWGELCQDVANNRLGTIYRGTPATEFALPRRDLLDPTYHVASVATSRGCPMGCEFCSVTKYSGAKYRRQPIDLVLQDLANVQEYDLFLVDDNFVGPTPHDREQAIAILKCLCGMNKRFICQVTMSVCQDVELLELLREAGCRMIFIGVETGDTEGLRLVGKRQNLRYGFDFSRVHAAGIGVLGSFIVGFDSDSPEKLRKQARFMTDESGVDCCQLTILTPLPGTAMFDKLLHDGRLLYTNFPSDWSRFSLTELVYVPKGFRCEAEFYDMLLDLVHQIYSKETIDGMVRRTREVTGCAETATYSYYTNRIYADATLDKAKIWESDKAEAEAAPFP